MSYDDILEPLFLGRSVWDILRFGSFVESKQYYSRLKVVTLEVWSYYEITITYGRAVP